MDFEKIVNADIAKSLNESVEENHNDKDGGRVVFDYPVAAGGKARKACNTSEFLVKNLNWRDDGRDNQAEFTVNRSEIVAALEELGYSEKNGDFFIGECIGESTEIDQLKEEYRYRVKKIFNGTSDHFWIPVKDKYLTGEFTSEQLDNGKEDNYVFSYLTDKIDHDGYSCGDVTRDAYINPDDDDKTIDAYFDFLMGGLNECDQMPESAETKKRVCSRCHHEVSPSDVEGYPYVCKYCDENLYDFETEEVDADKCIEFPTTEQFAGLIETLADVEKSFGIVLDTEIDVADDNMFWFDTNYNRKTFETETEANEFENKYQEAFSKWCHENGYQCNRSEDEDAPLAFWISIKTVNEAIVMVIEFHVENAKEKCEDEPFLKSNLNWTSDNTAEYTDSYVLEILNRTLKFKPGVDYEVKDPMADADHWDIFISDDGVNYAGNIAGFYDLERAKKACKCYNRTSKRYKGKFVLVDKNGKIIFDKDGDRPAEKITEGAEGRKYEDYTYTIEKCDGEDAFCLNIEDNDGEKVNWDEEKFGSAKGKTIDELAERAHKIIDADILSLARYEFREYGNSGKILRVIEQQLGKMFDGRVETNTVDPADETLEFHVLDWQHLPSEFDIKDALESMFGGDASIDVEWGRYNDKGEKDEEGETISVFVTMKGPENINESADSNKVLYFGFSVKEPVEGLKDKIESGFYQFDFEGRHFIVAEALVDGEFRITSEAFILGEIFDAVGDEGDFVGDEGIHAFIGTNKSLEKEITDKAIPIASYDEDGNVIECLNVDVFDLIGMTDTVASEVFAGNEEKEIAGYRIADEKEITECECGSADCPICGKKKINENGRAKSGVIIKARREGYSPSQCENIMTVGDLVDELEHYDGDLPVFTSSDDDYTFGSISYDDVREEEETGDEATKTIVAIEANREGYNPSQCYATMTVDELINTLEHYDGNLPALISNDNGYTYGPIDADGIYEKTIEELEESSKENEKCKKVCFTTSDQTLIDALNSGMTGLTLTVKTVKENGEEGTAEIAIKPEAIKNLNISDCENPKKEMEECDCGSANCPICGKKINEDIGWLAKPWLLREHGRTREFHQFFDTREEARKYARETCVSWGTPYTIERNELSKSVNDSSKPWVLKAHNGSDSYDYYFDAKEKAEKFVERLKSYYPNMTYEIEENK